MDFGSASRIFRITKSLLITVYAKNEQSDLSAADRRAIARIIGLIKQQLEQEVIK